MAVFQECHCWTTWGKSLVSTGARHQVWRIETFGLWIVVMVGLMPVVREVLSLLWPKTSFFRKGGVLAIRAGHKIYMKGSVLATRAGHYIIRMGSALLLGLVTTFISKCSVLATKARH